MQKPSLTPPIAEREPHATPIHNTELHDDYAWLRDKGAPRVVAYLKAENAYTAANMAGTEALQETLYDEILSHIKEDDVSVPYRDGAWIYLTRTEKGKQYAPLPPHGQPTTPDAPELVILDVNQLAEGQPFMSVGALGISPDGNLLAYTTDNTGFRQYTLHIRDLRTGTDLPTPPSASAPSPGLPTPRTLFYTTEDEQTKRQDRALPPHPRRTRSRRRRNLPRAGRALQPRHRPHPRPPVPAARSRQPHHQRDLLPPLRQRPQATSASSPRASTTRSTTIDHRDGFFYIRTNHHAKQFRLITHSSRSTRPRRLAGSPPRTTPTPRSKTSTSSRTSSSPATASAACPSSRVFHSRRRATSPSPRADIAFPDPAYAAGSRHQPRLQHHHLPLHLPVPRPSRPPSSATTSPPAPPRSSSSRRSPAASTPPTTPRERLWFSAHDGTEVPVSLVYRKDNFHDDAQSPLYVYGYGSYGYPLPLGFSASRLALLDRGIVIAYAHIRGGGELGDPWHDAGKMMLKRNTFTDFIEATEFLVREGYGDPARVAIEGGTAGGLLMGAVVNLAIEQGNPISSASSSPTSPSSTS